MLQKRKFPKLSTQTFTDPKKRILEVVALQHQVSSGVPGAPGHLSKSPTSKTTGPKEQRLSNKQENFIGAGAADACNIKLQIYSGVLQNRLSHYSGLRKEGCSGSSVGPAWPHHTHEVKHRSHTILKETRDAAT